MYGLPNTGQKRPDYPAKYCCVRIIRPAGYSVHCTPQLLLGRISVVCLINVSVKGGGGEEKSEHPELVTGGRDGEVKIWDRRRYSPVSHDRVFHCWLT
jgi:hypothetical protein